MTDSERGAWTGLPLDLPPGRHPFDPCLQLLTHVLGAAKTAAFLGVTLDLPPTRVDADAWEAPDGRPILTAPVSEEYL